MTASLMTAIFPMMIKRTFNKKKPEVLFLLLVAAALIAAAVVSLFFIRVARVDGASMDDTLNAGDIILLEQCSYRKEEPQRGDIIAFCKKDVARTLIIKRIAALPGETVEILHGTLYINGISFPEYSGFPEDMPPCRVEENSYFVLGDNIAQSVDSRAWEQPFVRREEIRGRYWLRIGSFG